MTELTTKRIVKGTDVAEFAREIYMEAFDRRMRVPFDDLFKACASGKGDFVAVYNEDLFIGFYYVYRYKDIAYLYYLAVEKSMRERGYGTEILDIVKDAYPGQRIVLCIEAPLVDDKLVSTSYRRLGFYSRNGFIDTLFKFTSVGVTYEVLYWGPAFDPSQVEDILRSFRRSCGPRR